MQSGNQAPELKQAPKSAKQIARENEEATFTRTLYSYISENKLEEASDLLEDKRIFTELTDSSSLHLALALPTPNPAMIRLLLSKGADKTKLNSSGRTPIARAAILKNWDIVSVFAEFPTDRNDKACYFAALQRAVVENKKDIVKSLLTYPNVKVDEQIEGGYSQTLLHVVVRRNQPDILDALLKYGCKSLNTKDNAEWTPLSLAQTAAKESNRPECLKTITDFGTYQRNSSTLTQSLYAYIKGDNLEAATTLLKDKVSFQELAGQSSLHLALDRQSPNPAMIALLLQKGADRTREGRAPSYRKALQTPIARAAREERWEIVKEFAKFPTDRNDDALYANALLHAVADKKDDVAKVLLARPYVGAAAYSDTKNSALHLAAQADLGEVFSLLLEYGFDPTWLNNEDKTPWELAQDCEWLPDVLNKYNAQEKIKTTFKFLAKAKEALDDHEIGAYYDEVIRVNVDLKKLIEYVAMNTKRDHQLENIRKFLMLVYKGLEGKIPESSRRTKIQLIQSAEKINAQSESEDVLLARACYKALEHIEGLGLERLLAYLESSFRGKVEFEKINSFLSFLAFFDKNEFAKKETLDFYKKEIYLVFKGFLASLPRTTKQEKAALTRIEDIFLQHKLVDARVKIDIAFDRWKAGVTELGLECNKAFGMSYRKIEEERAKLERDLNKEISSGLSSLEDIDYFKGLLSRLSEFNSRFESYKHWYDYNAVPSSPEVFYGRINYKNKGWIDEITKKLNTLEAALKAQEEKIAKEEKAASVAAASVSVSEEKENLLLPSPSLSSSTAVMSAALFALGGLEAIAAELNGTPTLNESPGVDIVLDKPAGQPQSEEVKKEEDVPVSAAPASPKAVVISDEVVVMPESQPEPEPAPAPQSEPQPQPSQQLSPTGAAAARQFFKALDQQNTGSSAPANNSYSASRTPVKPAGPPRAIPASQFR